MDVVYLRWYADTAASTVYQAVHASLDGALAQAAAEPGKIFLGIYDGPDSSAVQLADVPKPTI